MTGTFGFWQPEYAAHGLPTFPVSFRTGNGRVDKVPAVAGYMKLGMRGSQALARKFDRADALGVACGRRNGLVVVDVDAPDETLLGDVMSFYGESPLVARTPSGGHHVFYRSNGASEDRRRIRDAHWRSRGVPIDVLGNGFVVLPPSRGPNGAYAFVQGTPADVERLPAIRAGDPVTPTGTIPEGRRNDELWRHCMRRATPAGCFDDVLAAAQSFNAMCTPPLADAEVISTAQSAWSYTERGANRFGQHGAYFPLEEVVGMREYPDAFYVLAFLRAHNGPRAQFMCANGLSEKLGWDRRRFSSARNRLIELGHIKCIRRAFRGYPALYQWRQATCAGRVA